MDDQSPPTSGPDSNTAPPLDSAARKALKAQAHPLKPVVMIAQAGLSPTVLAEIERALVSHQLIKIRVFDDDREARAALLAEICARTGAAPVQQIGKLLVVWRPAPLDDPLTGPTRKARRKPNAPYQPKKAAGAGQAAPLRAPSRTRRESPAAGDRPGSGSARGKASEGAATPTRRGGRATPLARGAALGKVGSPGSARRMAQDGDAAASGRSSRRDYGAPTSVAKPVRPGRAPALVSPGERLRTTIARKKRG